MYALEKLKAETEKNNSTVNVLYDVTCVLKCHLKVGNGMQPET